MADEAASAPRRPTAAGSPSRFTALELVAAEQLIHLSESSCSSGAPAAALSSTPRGFGCVGGGGMLLLPASGGTAAASAASSSSASPRSVNNAPPPLPPAAVAAAEEEDEDDEQEVGGRRRRNKRYRPIAEIYAATEPPKPIGGRRRKAHRTRTDGAAAAKEGEARK